MIHPRYLSELLYEEPFRPFRLHMASGRVFEIRHPEMISVGKTKATVYYPLEGKPEAYQRQEISLMLLESIEPMEPAAKGGNGSPRQ